MLSSAPSDGGVRFAVSSDLIRAMLLEEAAYLKDDPLYGMRTGRESRVRAVQWLAEQIVPNQHLELTPAHFDMLSRLTDSSTEENKRIYMLVRALARLAEKKETT
jgi:hypothetical protein